MKLLSPRTDDNEFNVRAYGAVGDGSADEATAFQAAADAAEAYAVTNGQAVLRIPSGKYKLNSPFRVIGGNVSIIAYGAYIYAGNAATDLFRDWTSQDSSFTLNGSGLQILGGTWDMKGHTWAQGVEGSSPFTLSNSSNILLRDISIRNVKSYHGIDLNTCNHVTIDNVRLEGFKNSYEWKTITGNSATTVVAATTAAITLSGTQTIDGVGVTAGQRVLVKNQAATQDNGLYQCNAGAWTRTPDMDTAAECNDAAVFISGGTVNAGISYIQTATIVTIGTTPQVWTTYWKKQVRVATTAAGTLASSFENGDTVDGVVLATGDRILLKNQASSAENGIYTVNASGAPTRATDANSAALLNGASVYITAGTANASAAYKQTATITTLGTDPVTWSTEFRINRYFSEAIQLDDGPNDEPCTNVTVTNCYMGPAEDGSGLLSFGKLVGSHTDSTNGLYTNIKVTACTSVASLSNAIQGKAWADATIADNTILGSGERGIKMDFNVANIGPRLSITGNMISETVHHGIEVDGSNGSFGDINISNNVITSAVMVSPGTGIRITTIDRVTVANNSIKLEGSPSSQQGIYLLTINGGVVSGNGIYNAGTFGIQTSAVSRVSFTGNHIYACGQDGIYLTGVTTKCICTGNSIVGAGRTANVTYSGITVSNSANLDNSIIGNKFNKFGSGNEAKSPIEIEGLNPVDTNISGNTFGGDWGGAGLGNYTWANNTTINLDDACFTAVATATTSIAATNTLITGLSLTNVPPGTWMFQIWVPVTASGSNPTQLATLISPTGTTPPTLTAGKVLGNYWKNGVAPLMTQLTTTIFNTSMLAGATLTTSAPLDFEATGSFTSTNTGTINVAMVRTGGTTVTAQIGSFLRIQRVN